MTHFLYHIIYSCSIMSIDLIYNMSEYRRWIYFYKFDRCRERDDSELLVRSRRVVRPRFFAFLLLARNGYSVCEQTRVGPVDIAIDVL